MSNREFTVGDTLSIICRVSEAGTNNPADPATVRISAIERDGVPMPLPPSELTRMGFGLWMVSVQTAGWVPGVYDIQITVADGPERVAQVRDTFVLVSTLQEQIP